MISEETPVSFEEELKLRKSFEFGAYILITQYLAKTYDLEELRRFAKFWAETASASRRNIMERSKEEFLAWEAKMEKVWIGRDVERLDSKGYVGVVKSCPLKLLTNKHHMKLPIDYFCDYICSIIYTEGYRLLGLDSRIEKVKEGCRLEITL
jgi:hypothetical protein